MTIEVRELFENDNLELQRKKETVLKNHADRCAIPRTCGPGESPGRSSTNNFSKKSVTRYTSILVGDWWEKWPLYVYIIPYLTYVLYKTYNKVSHLYAAYI